MGGRKILHTQKRGKNSPSQLLLSIFGIILLSYFVLAQPKGDTDAETVGEARVTTNIVLAETINGDAIDDPYIESYLQQRNNFESIPFDSFGEQNEINYAMRAGNVLEDIRGITDGEKGYVVHLIDCYEEKQACAFRINGVPTGWIVSQEKKSWLQKSTFKINKQLKLKVNSIKFDFCDNKRFCNRFYEAYDLVKISLRREM